MAGNVETARTVGKTIAKLCANTPVDEKQAMDAVKTLQKLNLSKDDVKAVGLGRAVNDLRKKSSDIDVKKEINNLLNSWRNSAAGKKSRTLSSSSAGEAPKAPSERERFKDMMTQALTRKDSSKKEAASRVAAEIEEAIFTHKPAKDYSAWCRTRLANLHKNNYVEDLLSGELDPRHFAVMHPRQMLTKAEREAKEKSRNNLFKEKQLGVQEGQSSTFFTCPKCFKKDATYFELQTRSADEPMTVFATCNNCGKHWKPN